MMGNVVDVLKEIREAQLGPEDMLSPGWYIPGPINLELFEDEGELIGNTNTKISHLPDCRALKMMLEEHKTHTDGEGYRP
ncbi:MAG: hypothetical protein K8E24_002960, partial [Methanobacterium paludis]|nr:hypothetical protein [Methanobacterium paludis]